MSEKCAHCSKLQYIELVSSGGHWLISRKTEVPSLADGGRNSDFFCGMLMTYEPTHYTLNSCIQQIRT